MEAPSQDYEEGEVVLETQKLVTKHIEEEIKGFAKVRGLVFMFLNICCLAVQYISQKVLLADSIARGNPINPNEWTYWITLILLFLDLLAMKYLKADLFPLPKGVRATYILRCVVGMMCNLTFLFSL